MTAGLRGNRKTNRTSRQARVRKKEKEKQRQNLVSHRCCLAESNKLYFLPFLRAIALLSDLGRHDDDRAFARSRAIMRVDVALEVWSGRVCMYVSECEGEKNNRVEGMSEVYGISDSARRPTQRHAS